MPVNVIFKEPAKHRFETLWFLYALVMLVGMMIVNLPGFIIYEVKHRGEDPYVMEGIKEAK